MISDINGCIEQFVHETYTFVLHCSDIRAVTPRPPHICLTLLVWRSVSPAYATLEMCLWIKACVFVWVCPRIRCCWDATDGMFRKNTKTNKQMGTTIRTCETSNFVFSSVLAGRSCWLSISTADSDFEFMVTENGNGLWWASHADVL